VPRLVRIANKTDLLPENLNDIIHVHFPKQTKNVFWRILILLTKFAF